MQSLCQPRNTRNGERVTLFLTKRHGNDVYYAMPKEVLYYLVCDNSNFYNKQCDHHNRPELRTDALEKRFAAPKIHAEGENLKPLIAVADMARQIEKPRHFEWAESVVKDICAMAEREKKTNKNIKGFAHLNGKGEFKATRKGVDKACRHLGEMVDDVFFRINGFELSGNVRDDIKKRKGYGHAKRRLDQIAKLKGTGERKAALRGFMLRCAKNFFEALKPGMDTYANVKRGYPKSVSEFILRDAGSGLPVANFLLHYDPPQDVHEVTIDRYVKKIKGRMGGRFLEKVFEYDSSMGSSKDALRFYQNIWDLVEGFQELREKGETSYWPESCFDFVFAGADEKRRQHKVVHPGYFGWGSKTVQAALRHIRDK